MRSILLACAVALFVLLWADSAKAGCRTAGVYGGATVTYGQPMYQPTVQAGLGINLGDLLRLFCSLHAEQPAVAIPYAAPVAAAPVYAPPVLLAPSYGVSAGYYASHVNTVRVNRVVEVREVRQVRNVRAVDRNQGAGVVGIARAAFRTVGNVVGAVVGR